MRSAPRQLGSLHRLIQVKIGIFSHIWPGDPPNSERLSSSAGPTRPSEQWAGKESVVLQILDEVCISLERPAFPCRISTVFWFVSILQYSISFHSRSLVPIRCHQRPGPTLEKSSGHEALTTTRFSMVHDVSSRCASFGLQEQLRAN